MLRTRRLWISLIVAIVGVGLANATPARAAGGCSPASAPQIAPATTQSSDPTVCPDGTEYWAMSLQIGDTVTVNGSPTPSSGGANYMNLDIYGPNVQTIGQPLCNSDGNTSSFTETCMIPATGTYLLVSNEGSGTFTPRVNHPLLAVLHRVFSRWSPSARHSVLHVQASSPAATSVCMLIVLGWRALPRHLSCDNSHLVVLAAGRRVFTRAGRARVSVRFTRRARRLLTAHRLHRVTLIAMYTHRHRPPAIAAMRVRFRPR